MMEAQIKCLCADYRIADLGLVLTRGQMAYIQGDKALASAELRHATKVRAVEVRWGSRCEVSKSPTPPWLQRKTRTFQVPEPAVSRDEIERQTKDAVRLEVRESLRDLIREELQQALRGAPQSVAPPPVDTNAIVEAVRSALGAAGAPVARAPKVSDGPMFIPTGIVPTETKGAIEIPSATSSGEEVADTAAALKAARGRTRKKQE